MRFVKVANSSSLTWRACGGLTQWNCFRLSRRASWHLIAYAGSLFAVNSLDNSPPVAVFRNEMEAALALGRSLEFFITGLQREGRDPPRATSATNRGIVGEIEGRQQGTRPPGARERTLRCGDCPPLSSCCSRKEIRAALEEEGRRALGGR
jgi:hypothetical protein